MTKKTDKISSSAYNTYIHYIYTIIYRKKWRKNIHLLCPFRKWKECIWLVQFRSGCPLISLLLKLETRSLESLLMASHIAEPRTSIVQPDTPDCNILTRFFLIYSEGNAEMCKADKNVLMKGSANGSKDSLCQPVATTNTATELGVEEQEASNMGVATMNSKLLFA